MNLHPHLVIILISVECSVNLVTSHWHSVPRFAGLLISCDFLSLFVSQTGNSGYHSLYFHDENIYNMSGVSGLLSNQKKYGLIRLGPVGDDDDIVGRLWRRYWMVCVLRVCQPCKETKQRQSQVLEPHCFLFGRSFVSCASCSSFPLHSSGAPIML